MLIFTLLFTRYSIVFRTGNDTLAVQMCLVTQLNSPTLLLSYMWSIKDNIHQSFNDNIVLLLFFYFLCFSLSYVHDTVLLLCTHNVRTPEVISVVKLKIHINEIFTRSVLANCVRACGMSSHWGDSRTRLAQHTPTQCLIATQCMMLKQKINVTRSHSVYTWHSLIPVQQLISKSTKQITLQRFG